MCISVNYILQLHFFITFNLNLHCKFGIMDYAENILGTIGNTPMVKMNKLVEELDCLVLINLDFDNLGINNKVILSGQK